MGQKSCFIVSSIVHGYSSTPCKNSKAFGLIVQVSRHILFTHRPRRRWLWSVRVKLNSLASSAKQICRSAYSAPGSRLGGAVLFLAAQSAHSRRPPLPDPGKNHSRHTGRTHRRPAPPACIPPGSWCAFHRWLSAGAAGVFAQRSCTGCSAAGAGSPPIPAAPAPA